MNILVTGGAGFIGSHVCESLLEKGHKVYSFDNLDDFYDPNIKLKTIQEVKTKFPNFVSIVGDLLERKDLKMAFASVKFDQVIHLAAKAGVRPSLEKPALYQRVNVEGTVNLLEAAKSAGVKKFIIASSSSVYGVNSKVPFSEDDPIKSPISPYAASKLACEALGHVYHHIYGFDIVMLRFFTVYGPRQRPDLAIHKFAALMYSDKPIPIFGDGSTARDYTYITDTVQGVVKCVDKEFGYEIINLGESQTVTLLKLVELLEKAMNKKAKIINLPPQPGDVPITYANIEKARKLLNYNPTTKIEDGIKLFVDWFLKMKLNSTNNK
ncbi:MAG: SDR family NAD(P)-dependent oxidoreductase [Verrucomicrobiia bacterium]